MRAVLVLGIGDGAEAGGMEEQAARANTPLVASIAIRMGQ
jgi:hypothetical protein